MTEIRRKHIKCVIDDWDPIELLSSYAPPDEYDSESEKIYIFIKKSDAVDRICLGGIIFEVFMQSFGDDVFLKSLDECIDIAEKIINSNHFS
jgi:hypothetical protein